ncbi:MAG: peptide ABC transporter permease, partial [Arthrobacter sp.]
MLKYTIRRLGQLVLVMFILSMVLFIWLRSLPGGLESSICGDRCTAEKRSEIRRVLGLDEPVFLQYFKFLGR